MIKEEYELTSNTETFTKHKPDVRTTELSRTEAENAIEVLTEDDYPENVARSSPKSLRQAAERRAFFKSPIRRSIDNIRKTKSSALPAAEILRENQQSRVETVSSPDFTDNGGTTDEEYSCSNEESILKNEESTLKSEQLSKLNRLAICYDNLRYICLLLNGFVLIFSGMYFACALTLSIAGSIWLIMTYNTYALVMTLFYVMAFCLFLLAIDGFYLLWKVSRKIKTFAIVSLTLGAVNATMMFYLDYVQTATRANVELKLATTISQSDEYTKDAWDYIHNTFSCCGVNGFLDWCHLDDHASAANDTEVASYVGTYVCLIPHSCCKNQENTMRNESCREQLQSKKFGNPGCISFLQREIYHTGIMYKVIAGSVSTVLILLAIMVRILLIYIMK